MRRCLAHQAHTDCANGPAGRPGQPLPILHDSSQRRLPVAPRDVVALRRGLHPRTRGGLERYGLAVLGRHAVLKQLRMGIQRVGAVVLWARGSVAYPCAAACGVAGMAGQGLVAVAEHGRCVRIVVSSDA